MGVQLHVNYNDDPNLPQHPSFLLLPYLMIYMSEHVARGWMARNRIALEGIRMDTPYLVNGEFTLQAHYMAQRLQAFLEFWFSPRAFNQRR